MTDNPYIPADPGAIDWDVVIVGTGMGGATLGHELARLGQRVLFIEKGLLLQSKDADSAGVSGPRNADLNPEDPEARLRMGRWPLRLEGKTSFGGQDFFAPLGCGTGGSTTQYAAALERLWPADFKPRANFPNVTGTTLPESWPVTYEEMRPYYDRAEDLFRVRGTKDPLYQGGESNLRGAPPALSRRDQALFESFGKAGLHPYRVHVGFDFVDRCDECPGRACGRGCKSDAGWICVLPALEQHGAKILPQCEALSLEADASGVKSVRCRRAGETLDIRAKIFVLAAGAYMTPVLLLNSKSADWPDGLANRSGLVGRNLMFHVSDFIALRPAGRLSAVGPQKSLAFNDFYHVDGEKLGTFQSIGATVEFGQVMQYMRDSAEVSKEWWMKLASPRPRWWRKLSSPAIRLVALVAYHLLNYKHAAIWASVLEDLPYHHNRILPDPHAKNGMRFEYHYADELRARVLSFRRRLTNALGPRRMVVLSGENNINFGHVCGTCRFGDDAKLSVLDRNNRAHDVENLYVVDASFFPSSGGTNPSLTIAANALRVAAAIRRQLGQELPDSGA